MNKLRCLLFAVTVVISSATVTLGGDMQGPGKSEPPPPPPGSGSATYSTTDDVTDPSADVIEIAWQDLATMMLREVLITIYY